MADEKEKTERFNCRLPVSQVRMIKSLEKLGVLGSNKSAVARTLLQQSIDELVKSEFVKKYLESKELLDKLP